MRRNQFLCAMSLVGLLASATRGQELPDCVELSPNFPFGDGEVVVTALDAAGDPIDLSTYEIVEIGFGEAGFAIDLDDPAGAFVDTSDGVAVFTITQAMLDSTQFELFFSLPNGGGEAFIGLAGEGDGQRPFETTAAAFAAGGNCALPNLPVCIRLSPTDPTDGEEVTVTGIDADGEEIDLSRTTIIEFGFAPAGALPVIPDTSTGKAVFIITQAMLDSTYFDMLTVIPGDETHFFVDGLAGLNNEGELTVADVFEKGGNCNDGVPACLELPTEVAAGQEVAITALNRFGQPVDMSTLEIIEIGFGEAGFGLNVENPDAAFFIDTSSGQGVFTITAEMLASDTFNVFILPGEIFFGFASAEEPFPFDTTADAFAAGGNCDLAPPPGRIPACIEISPTDPSAGDEITITAFDRDGEEIDLSTVILVETGWAPAGTNAVFPDLSSGRGVMTVTEEMLESDYLDFFVLVGGGDEAYFALARFGQRTPFNTVAEAIAAGGNCSAVLVPAGAPACLELSPTNPSGGDVVTISGVDRDGAPVDMSTLNAVEIGFGEGGFVIDNNGSLDTSSGDAVFTITQEMVDSNRMDFFALLPDGAGDRGIVLAHPEEKSPFDSAAAAFANGGNCGDIPVKGLPVCVELAPPDPKDGDLVILTAFDFQGEEVDLTTLRNVEIAFGEDAVVFEGDGNLDISTGSAEFFITSTMVDSEIFVFFAFHRDGEAPIVLSEPGEDTPFNNVIEAFAAGGSCDFGIPGVGPMIRGDCNGDGSSDLSDGIAMLNFLFVGDVTPGCLAACDFNGDGTTNITTAVYFFNAKFAGGLPIPPPNDCDISSEPTDIALECANPSCQ